MSEKPVSERRAMSASASKTFTKCRRQYWWNIKQKVSPVVTAPPLWLGSLYHECLASFYQDQVIHFGPTIRKWKKKREQEFQQLTDRAPEDWGRSDEVDRLVEDVRTIMEGYVAKYAQQDMENWEVLAVEQPFRLALPVPCSACNGSGIDGGWSAADFAEGYQGRDKCAKCDGVGFGRKSPRWDWRGKLDLVARRKSDGSIYIFEHKTTTIKNPDKYETGLLMDNQPRAYVWAVRQMYGEDCRGLVYNVIRKKIPSVPKTTQCRTCKGDGLHRMKVGKSVRKTSDPCSVCNGTGVGGLSMAKNPDTTRGVYTARLASFPHIAVEPYGEVLSALTARGDTFLYRFLHHVPQRDVNDWLADAYDVCREVRHAETIDRWPRNVNACDHPFGRCPYHSICLEDDQAARQNFRIRAVELPEFEDDEEEKKQDSKVAF